MSSPPSSPSTSVVIDPPDIATPVWPPVQPRLAPPSHLPTLQSTPTQFSSPHQRVHVQFATMLLGGAMPTPFQPDPMQSCASSEATPPSLVSQHGLPGYLPTPEKKFINSLYTYKDFFALHPLDDIDILATFRTFLYGTARDWWEVAQTSITTWNQFESAFPSAFLSEDYEDELAERVRTKTQG
ncbi:hypothetical protein QQF64_034171 [Cirrhinus molitorella]|uniref:Retrotransposon gag domain-containing protein n=1 Tax=Cirrhinus molitorella TaxID=172907 RepID=A0ABR3MVZ0_9TELE